MDFTRILEEDIEEREVKEEGYSPPTLKKMETKINILIALVAVLILLNLQSLLR